MYRKTIEHPDYLPVEIRKRTDFEGGKTMGRIWRVVRDDAKPEDLRRLRDVNLAGASTPDLCETLRNPDGWWRDTAHRLLLERRDPDAVKPLRAIAADPQAPPASVVHALRLLEALDALDDEAIRQALKHPAAPVREHALQLAEPSPRRRARPGSSGSRPLADDEDARVRFQAAITLGEVRPATDGGERGRRRCGRRRAGPDRRARRLGPLDASRGLQLALGTRGRTS